MADVEWRSPEDALKLDVSLVEHIFRRLARQRASRFHPDMAFSKSDVLATLEQAHGFLQKRPLLRMLHTSLACVSHEKEGASVEGFVRFRIKERSLSFAAARERLLQIHTRVQHAAALERQVQAFTRAAHARSPWCVRDWKSVCRSPAQLYKLHVLPARPKTPAQLDSERRALHAVAAGVVANALQLSVAKLVDAAKAPSSRRSVRGRSEADAAAPRRPGARGDAVLRANARRRREQGEAEARCRELRLQIFIPAIETSALPARSAESASARATAAADAQDTSDDDDEAPGGARDSALDAPRGSEDTTTRTSSLLLLLATAEANGDPRLAERLAAQPIARSGFRRARAQARNLGLARDDRWGLLKTWASVYRAHALQSLAAARAPHT